MGVRRLHVDLAAARGPAVGADRLPPLLRPARPAVRRPGRGRVPRIDAVPAPGRPPRRTRPARALRRAGGAGQADRGAFDESRRWSTRCSARPACSTCCRPTPSWCSCRASATRGDGAAEAAEPAVAAWAAGRRGRRRHRLPDHRRAQLGIPHGVAGGVLVLPLPDGQFVAVVPRRAGCSTVDWGGDPHNKAIAEQEGDAVRLCPRKSFDRWRETVQRPVRGRGRRPSWPRPPRCAPPARGALRPVRSVTCAPAETLQRSLLSDPPEPDHLQSPSATCPRRGGPRSAATGTTSSASPTARRCW